MSGGAPPGPSPPADPRQALHGPPLQPFAERSVGALVRACAEAFPQRPALRFRLPSGRWQELSFAALDRRRRSLAAGLLALGVEHGDRVPGAPAPGDHRSLPRRRGGRPGGGGGRMSAAINFLVAMTLLFAGLAQSGTLPPRIAFGVAGVTAVAAFSLAVVRYRRRKGGG